jgi:RND family efflux transporter MFP subunit
VKAGALLVQLDDRDRVLALRRQQASSMEAHAAQIRASTLVAKAKDLEQRLAKLEKHELVSEEALAQARIDLRTARAAVAQTQAQAALRYVEILTARRELDRARIRAPFSGRLSKRLVAVGDRVDVGTPLVELVGGAGLELHLYVPVSTVNRVKPEAPVRFRLAGRGARWHKGRLTRVLPVVDPLSRNQTAVVALPAPPPGFTPGLAVEARLVVGRIADALVVSSDALSRLGARWVVFKVQTGKARRVAVRILGEDDRKVAVSGGLAAGDPVVVVGNEALFPNAPVRVVNPPAVASQGAGGPRPAAANSR